MKRIVGLLLVLAIAGGLAACSDSHKNDLRGTGFVGGFGGFGQQRGGTNTSTSSSNNNATNVQGQGQDQDQDQNQDQDQDQEQEQNQTLST